MWGQGDIALPSHSGHRIIPTRVGTRIQCTDEYTSDEDHPHACGDKHTILKMRTAAEGSSPRVWGQEYRRSVKVTDKRIIPTRVGTSIASICHVRQSRDHPHACGDKYIRDMATLRTGGSSPRVWGQVFPFPLERVKRRIIPTRVGTS